MRLIDADALASTLNNGRLEEQTGRAVPFNAGVSFALTMVEYAPTIEPKRGEWIDTVPVVRCKDCKHWQPSEYGVVEQPYCKHLGYKEETGLDIQIGNENDYCSFGERKDDE